MITLVLALVFVAVVYTGPACVEMREIRRRERDVPIARIIYLPSTAYRPDEDLPGE